ncbi:NAD(P)/FAD-dependent oxidoreductase [Frankia sp. Ag45/Mut15]|uniref:Pyridine nucleotide-disulfide oxidoreductase domain-containing protein 2 n=1 Tax=Frankia umida TaxID=573489 RepID=A0ABT0K1A8_9ACTN|nr:NAD(P)/FAD-dependent oxidoreductase [Frankia umida]MCK9877525.1 NAD(P)/FAD-dependent oxidoreductase [Frankia umida]
MLELRPATEHRRDFGGDALPAVADVVVVGGGHNGLACAAYLARAGRRVVLLEARDEVGGCASTVDAIGARVNICNCDHTMVLASGIVEELELGAYGLRYLDVDPMGIAMGWGDEPVFVHWRSIERTMDGLARTDPAAAAAYRRYLDVALPAARLVQAVQQSRPSSLAIAASAGRRRLRGSATVLAWARASLQDVLGSFGLPPWLIAAAHTNGPAVWGLAPDAPGSGLGALGFALRHLIGVARPAGGSGALPAALAACARQHGAQLITGARVAGVQIRDGRVRGVRLADGRSVRAPTVVTATDPRTVLVDWLDGVPAAARLRARWAAVPAADGYESKLDAVSSALPGLRALQRLPVDVLPADTRHVPTVLVSPTPAEQVSAAAARHAGRVRDPPMLLLNVPSVLDPTLRPTSDTHLLSLEVLWTPYQVAGGWDDQSRPWSWLRRLASLGDPGLLAAVRDWRVMTPPDYEREFTMARGYAPSFPGGAVAALLGRQRELSRYRTPVAGLYLTGAGTFPGAGVWGASGRNTAAVILARRPDRLTW